MYHGVLIYGGNRMMTQRPMPLKEDCITFPEKRGPTILCRATWGSTRFGWEAERSRRKPALLGFPQGRQGRQSEQFRIGGIWWMDAWVINGWMDRWRDA